jgi:hypothetical protein
MNTNSVYIETSIISYLAGRASRDLLLAACQQVTRDWWQDHRARYELFASQLVVAEAAAGDPELAKKLLAYLEGIPELQVTTEVGDLARALVTEGAFPPRARPMRSILPSLLSIAWICS